MTVKLAEIGHFFQSFKILINIDHFQINFKTFNLQQKIPNSTKNVHFLHIFPDLVNFIVNILSTYQKLTIVTEGSEVNHI